MFKFDLRPFQAECIAAMLEGKNVICVTACGEGKTVVLWGLLGVLEWVLFRTRGKPSGYVQMVVTPRNGISEQTAALIRGAGLTAIALNGDTIREGRALGRSLVREVAERRHQVVVVGPEFFNNSELDDQPLLPTFLPSILSVLLDELHTLHSEGTAFRPAFSRIKDFLHRCVQPVIRGGVTATLSKRQEAYACKELSLSTDGTFTLRRTNERLNVKWIVKYGGNTPAHESSWQDLDWTLEQIYPAATAQADLNAARRRNTQVPPLAPPPPPPPLPPFVGSIIIFVDTIKETTELVEHLRSLLPSRLHQLVQPSSSIFEASFRQATQRALDNGTVRVLVATRVAELGLDLRRCFAAVVYRIVDVTLWVQAAGRVARTSGDRGAIVVYPQPSLEPESSRVARGGARAVPT